MSVKMLFMPATQKQLNRCIAIQYCYLSCQVIYFLLLKKIHSFFAIFLGLFVCGQIGLRLCCVECIDEAFSKFFDQISIRQFLSHSIYCSLGKKIVFQLIRHQVAFKFYYTNWDTNQPFENILQLKISKTVINLGGQHNVEKRYVE